MNWNDVVDELLRLRTIGRPGADIVDTALILSTSLDKDGCSPPDSVYISDDDKAIVLEWNHEIGMEIIIVQENGECVYVYRTFDNSFAHKAEFTIIRQHKEKNDGGKED